MWVFGYGSLIWEPGFAYAEAVPARLDGWHRSFCMRSIHYRGTETAPGLVLALDAAAGAACHGLAFRVMPGSEAVALDGLRARELISSAYREERLPVALADGRREVAVTYVIDRDHGQYCGGIDAETQARIIAAAAGLRGPNRDYLWNTARHLADLGLPDPELEALADRVRALCAG